MGWVRLDDQRHQHPKVLAVSLEADGLYGRALTWSSNNLTDGHIPTRALGLIAAGDSRAKRLAGELVAAGLWNATKDGWAIHDYLAYQPSGAEERTRQRKAADRTRRWRESKGRRGDDPGDGGVTRHNGVTPPVRDSGGDAAVRPACALPDPEPLSTSHPQGLAGLANDVPPDGAGGEEEATSDPDDPATRRRQLLPSEHTPATLDGVCRTLAQQDLRRATDAGGRVVSPEKWLRAAADNHIAETEKLLEARPDISLAAAIHELGGDHPDDPTGDIRHRLRSAETDRYLRSMPTLTAEQRAANVANIREAKAKLRKAAGGDP